MTVDEQNIAQTCFEHGLMQYREPVPIPEPTHGYAVMPSSLEIHSLEQFMAAPVRIKESPQFYDVDSFAEYVNSFKGDATRLFASVSIRNVRASIDYHSPKSPSWDSHIALLPCQTSEDWSAWASHDCKAMGQTEFAEFIEDHTFNVIEPEGAAVLQMALNLEEAKTVYFRASKRLDNGMFSLEYTESESDQVKNQIKIASKLVLGINPFKFGVPAEITARLRYRINSGKLTFTYVLDHPQKVLEKAFTEVVAEVREKCGCPLHLTV